MTTSFFNLENQQFWDILERFVLNLVFLFLLLRMVYYRFSKRQITCLGTS